MARARQARRRPGRDRRPLVGSVGRAVDGGRASRARARVALYDAYVYDDQVPSFFRWAQTSGLGELLFALFYTERIEDRAPLAYYDERWVTQARVERVEREMDRARARPPRRSRPRAAITSRTLHEQLRDVHEAGAAAVGAQDEVTPLASASDSCTSSRDATLKVYPRCGHIPMVEAQNASTRDSSSSSSRMVAIAAESPTPTPTPAPTPTDATVAAGVVAAAASSRRGDAPQIPNIPRRSVGSRFCRWSRARSRRAGLAAPRRLRSAARRRFAKLPLGADLASLGAELTPRLYAAPREHTEVVAHGSLRVREAALYNLDLDRGLDATGKPIFPVPLGGGQELTSGDLRRARIADVRARRRRRRRSRGSIGSTTCARRRAPPAAAARDQRWPAPDDRRDQARVGGGTHPAG